MEFKNLIHKEDLENSTLEAIEELAHMVGRTLGPGGLPILIERKGVTLSGEPLSPMITKDGVTVAQNISVSDSSQDLVIQTVKAMAAKTNKNAGDGPQPLTSKVLTPRGFVEMRDIRVGMEICGTKGTFQTVLGVYPKGDREVYKVYTSDGRVVECCSEHLWNMNTAQGTNETKTTLELSKDFLKIDSNGNKRFRYFCPNTPVEFLENKAEMPLDPYLVGILLGDSSLSVSGSVELSLGLKKKHIIDKLVFPKGIYSNTTLVESKNSYRIKLQGETSSGKSMYDILSSIGLLERVSKTKFIPKSYLYSSSESRRMLLQGLIDTYGHVNTLGLFEFSTVSSELYSDFLELTRSLAIPTHHYKMESKQEHNSYSETAIIYKVSELKGYKEGTKIVNIEATGKTVPMQCIKVSNEDHLYVTDDYMTTHNTTTSTVLGHSILKAAVKAMNKNPKLNPQLVRLEIEKSILKVKELLKEQARQVEGYEDIKNVATISANGEDSIGEIIAQAFDEVGTEGVITIDEGSGPDNTLEIVDGYQFGRGAQAQNRFFNDENNTKWEAEDVNVLIYNGKLNAYQDLIPAFELLLKKNNMRALPPLLVIADEFSQQVVQFLLMQRAEMGATICAVRSPSMTTTRTNMMEDLAILLGGERLGLGTRHINNIKEDDIGIAKKIVVTGTTTTIYDGQGLEEDLIKRIDQLKVQRETAPSDFDKSNISDRIAALSQGIAKIGVGGQTELEMKERYHRIEDALNAARAAVTGGIIAGGGSTLFRIALQLEANNKEQKEPSIGDVILAEALKAPIERILENAGADVKAVLKNPVLLNNLATYDALNHKFVHAFNTGVVDPLNVTLSALENAGSIATLLATCGGGITIKRPVIGPITFWNQSKEVLTNTLKLVDTNKYVFAGVFVGYVLFEILFG